MNRRDAILALTALGTIGAPLRARAQRAGRERRLGVLIGQAENDPEQQKRFAGFRERLAELGWVEGQNLKIDARWSAGSAERAAVFARELIALKPEAILTSTTPATLAMRRETRTTPIVFVVVSDPVGSGLVETLARPGGNVTGFVNIEASIVEKGLELLKELAPGIKLAAMMFNPDTAPYAAYYMHPLNTAASKLGVRTLAAAVRSESDIEEAISRIGRDSASGLIVMTDSYVNVHRKIILALTSRNKVPAIWFNRQPVDEGGLISYGVDVFELFRRAAVYVDRVLRGAKPADMPVELPSKFELVVNRRTANMLGIKIPQSVLLRANDVVE